VLAAPGSLLGEGERVARRAAAPLTRATYATAYRAFARHLEAQLGRPPVPKDLTEDALAGYRDGLERAGRARATIAKELAALRQLAHALAGDFNVDAAAVARVKANRVAPRAPRALTRGELERLWAMPDLRTRRGKRDRALLMLLGAAGLRRAEACALAYGDLEELQRHPAPRRRDALVSAGERTAWVVHVREPTRGRARTVDLAEPVVEAIRDWTRSRPKAPTDHLFVSLPRNRPPGPLRPRAVNALVARYASRAGLPEDRRTPHVLRHTFCTLLADAGAGLEVVAELAGHADLRTTKGYVTVSPARRASAVHQTFDADTSARDRLHGGGARGG
jgi:integrase/recombinase XerC